MGKGGKAAAKAPIAESRARAYRPVGVTASPPQALALLLGVMAFCRPEIVTAALFFGGWTGVDRWINAAAIKESPLTAFTVGVVCTDILSVPFFFALCLLYERIYYVNRKDDPESWKCQPDKDLIIGTATRSETKKTGAHEYVRLSTWNRSEVQLAVINLTIASALSVAFVVIHVCMDGNFTKVHIDTPQSLLDCALFFAQGIAYFLFIDAWAWFAHRLMHRPWWYKRFHKVHHAYKAPSPFSALGLHPVDMVTLQGGVYAFVLICPIHFALVMANLLYIHYFNVVDHSGIYLESRFPWQATSLFHDDHHLFFHTNYGQSMTLWDRLGGTLHNPTIKYSEDLYETDQRKILKATKDN